MLIPLIVQIFSVMLEEGKCATHLVAFPARITWALKGTMYGNGLLALPPPLGPFRVSLCFCNEVGEGSRYHVAKFPLIVCL